MVAGVRLGRITLVRAVESDSPLAATPGDTAPGPTETADDGDGDAADQDEEPPAVDPVDAADVPIELGEGSPLPPPNSDVESAGVTPIVLGAAVEVDAPETVGTALVVPASVPGVALVPSPGDAS